MTNSVVSKYSIAAMFVVSCDTCGAPAGQCCRTAAGRDAKNPDGSQRVHAARRDRYVASTGKSPVPSKWEREAGARAAYHRREEIRRAESD